MLSSEELLLFNDFSASLKTKKNYLSLLGELKEYVRKDLLEVISDDIESFIDSRDNNSNTKRRKYHQLLSFYNYLLESGHIQSNPVREVSPPRGSKQVKMERTLEFGDIKKLLLTLKEHFGLRDYVFTLIIATTGMKLGEVRNLMWSDFFIDANDNIGVLIGPKNSQRYIRIFDFVWEAIENYRAEYLKVDENYLREDYYLFFSQKSLETYRTYPKLVKPISSDWITKTYTKACAIADIPLVTSKDIRHSYTMLSIKLGGELEGIKDQLGWSSTSFINRYNGVVELLESPINMLVGSYYEELLFDKRGDS